MAIPYTNIALPSEHTLNAKKQSNFIFQGPGVSTRNLTVIIHLTQNKGFSSSHFHKLHSLKGINLEF